MKTPNTLFLAILLVVIQPAMLTAQIKVKNYKMIVKGTSSLHEWESVAEKLECKTSYKIENNSLVDIKEAIVKIPVQSLKGSNGKIMDNKTYDAFNYEKHPVIAFTLSSKKINATPLTAELKGNLTMAGTTRPIDLNVSFKVLPNGDLQITGSKKIKMTEFNMEPPTAMMGAIKVGDEVTISFDIVLTNAITVL